MVAGSARSATLRPWRGDRQGATGSLWPAADRCALAGRLPVTRDGRVAGVAPTGVSSAQHPTDQRGASRGAAALGGVMTKRGSAVRLLAVVALWACAAPL